MISFIHSKLILIPLKQTFGGALVLAFVFVTVIINSRGLIPGVNIFNRTPVQLNASNNTFSHMKFVRSGPGINCLQRPLTNEAFFDKRFDGSGKFAYAWYVSKMAYLCSAIAALKNLKKIRSQQKDVNALQVDYVLIYSSDNFPIVSNTLSYSRYKKTLELWVAEGGILKEFKSLAHRVKDNYYRGCYEKFYVFMLSEYDRVIVMDADGLAVNNIDHLFKLSMPEGIRIAAPQGYWFKNEGIKKQNKECVVNGNDGKMVAITSSLLLVEPDPKLFERVSSYFGRYMPSRGHEYFDMDILNQEFSCKKEILVLPKMYATLDSEYMRKDSRVSSRLSMCKNFTNVQYLHFSGQGKPWSADTWAKGYLNGYEPEARQAVRQWFVYAYETCPWLVQSRPTEILRRR